MWYSITRKAVICLLTLNGRRYYTVRETANMLNLAEATIRKWIREGKIKAVKLGRGYIINVEGFSVFDRVLRIEQREE